MRNYKIAVAGTGYVGLSIATLLSQHHKVTAVDIIPEKVDMINNRKSPIQDDYIVKAVTGVEADSVVVDVNSLVSMNMWGLTPEFLDVLEQGFKEFFEKEVPGNPLKAEYLIPIFIGDLLEQGKMSVKVLKTNDTWYGMTYHEDVAAVKDSFKKMLEDGVYKADLFADL